MQTKAVHLIAAVTPCTNTDPLHSALNIMPLKSLYMYAIGLFMYKSSNEMFPELFANMFIHVKSIHITQGILLTATCMHHSIQLGIGKNMWSIQTLKCGILYYQR